MEISNDIMQTPLSRRTFLKAALVTTVGVALSPIPPPEAVAAEPHAASPIEVLGLNGEFKTVQDIERYYAKRDTAFCAHHGLSLPTDRAERGIMRQEKLDPTKRYVEVVVPVSTYASFQEQSGTKMDFPTYWQCQIDAFNRALSQAHPQTPITNITSRILVIQDNVVQELQGRDPSPHQFLDVTYASRFNPQKPLDCDEFWAVDPRYVKDKKIQSSCMYGFQRTPRGEILLPREEKTYSLGQAQDMLNTLQQGTIDYALIHELMHRLTSGTDERCSDIHFNPRPSLSAIESFTYQTNNFQTPDGLSPTLAWHIRRNYDTRQRGMDDSHRADDWRDRPATCRFTFSDTDRPGEHPDSISIGLLQVQRADRENKYSPVTGFRGTEIELPLTPDGITVSTDEACFYPMDTIIMSISNSDDAVFQLCLPPQMFNTAYAAGCKDDATFPFTLYTKTPAGTHQYAVPYDGTRSVKDIQKEMPPDSLLVATAKIPNTDVSLAWFQSPT